MITVRKGSERGKTELDWLDSKHTFSFGDYFDDAYVNFGPLRVINEDVVAPGKGFGEHPHRDMEIITYVIKGALQHRDSTGGGSVIRPGEVQRMSAGSGITHSEFNHSKSDPVHLLQIWIMPNKKGINPGYEQKKLELVPNQWHVIASPNGGDTEVAIQQDAKVLTARILSGSHLSYTLEKGAGWIQVVKGSVSMEGNKALAGDGIAISNEPGVSVSAEDDSEILLFDLPVT